MTTHAEPVDPSRCVLCGEANDCGAERGAGSCWCHAVKIPDDVLERVPPDLRDRACICEACASGGRTAPSSADSIEKQA